MRVLGPADIERALDADALVDALAAAFVRLSEGAVSMPPRAAIETGRGAMLLMGAHVRDAEALSVKLVSVYPHNPPGGPPAHQALIAVFDADAGTPRAVMDGQHVTALRTAAASRLATRLLARPDADVVAILGTGVQAEAHARALARERPLADVRIAGRRSAAAAALAERLGPPVRAVSSFAAALDGAGVVCACTASPEPVVRREWLATGAHVNSVGFTTSGREVDAATIRDALVVVESRESALSGTAAGSNDLTWPIRDGVVGPEHVHAELGELVAGTRPGRTSPAQLTLYKSVGVGVEDDVAARLVLAAAERDGLGTPVEL